MPDGSLFIRALTDRNNLTKPKETKETKGKSDKIDIGKRLIIGSDNDSEKQSIIAQLAQPAFDRAKAMEQIKNAGDGKSTYAGTLARRQEAAKVAQEELNHHLTEWASKRQGLSPDKVQAIINDVRNEIVGRTANGKSVTREEQIVSYQTDQLLYRFNSEEERRKQETSSANMTAGQAYEQSGRFGNPFES